MTGAEIAIVLLSASTLALLILVEKSRRASCGFRALT